MTPNDGISTRILPTTPEDIAANVVRVEVTAPRYRGFVVTPAPEIPNSVVAADRIRVGDVSPVRIGDTMITAPGGWCAPSEIVYNTADAIDYNEVATTRDFAFPRGGITFNVPSISPETMRVLWGQPSYTEETLL